MFFWCLVVSLNHFNPLAVERSSYEFGSAKYFAMCGLGGILSCGLTHTAMVPVDLVKCRVQVSLALLFALCLKYQLFCL